MAPGFARGAYGTHRFTGLEIALRPGRRLPPAEEVEAGTGAAATLWSGALLMRSRVETRLDSGGTDHRYLITTCRIAERDAPRFLDQFLTARNFLLRQPGFIRHHLFESRDPRATFQFVNVATWRRLDDFLNAFSSQAFKTLISGGFDHTSQIIVARRASALGNHTGTQRSTPP